MLRPITAQNNGRIPCVADVAELEIDSPDAAPTSNSRWYVVQTNHLEEHLAASELRKRDFQPLLPLVWRDPPHRDANAARRHRKPAIGRLVVAYPHYLFVLFDVQRDPWRRIYGTPGVRRLFSASPESPTPVPQAAMDRMLSRLSKLGAEPPPYAPGIIPDGAVVRIISGPIEGHEAVCVRGEMRQGKMRVMLLTYGTQIEVQREMVEPV